MQGNSISIPFGINKNGKVIMWPVTTKDQYPVAAKKARPNRAIAAAGPKQGPIQFFGKQPHTK